MHAAVLGLGSIGLRHGQNLMEMGLTVAGYDPDEPRAAAFSKLGGQVRPSRAEALEQADIAVIASPNRQHFDDLHAAITAKCHAYIEKPLAHSDRGVAQLLDDAEAKGLTVVAGHNLRSNAVVESAKQALGEGRIGKVLWARFQVSDYLPSWRPEQDHRTGYAADPQTGGVIFDLIHEFDIAVHLIGPAECLAAAAICSGCLDIESDDCADVILRHQCGAQTSLHLDYLTRVRKRGAEIVGSDGSMELDLDGRTLRIFDFEGGVVNDTHHRGSYANDYVRFMQAFLAAVNGQAENPCSGLDSLDVLRLALDARKYANLPAAN